MARRNIHEQNGRFGGESSGYRNTLLLAARKLLPNLRLVTEGCVASGKHG